MLSTITVVVFSVGLWSRWIHGCLSFSVTPTKPYSTRQQSTRRLQQSSSSSVTNELISNKLVATSDGKEHQVDPTIQTLSLPYNLHLFSLQWSSLDAQYFSKSTCDVWKWKDSVLGDGRDFFIPRPKTLRALQQYLMHDDSFSSSPCCTIQECMILSNCARFEIFLVTSPSSCVSPQDEAKMLTKRLSQKLLAQCTAYQQSSKRSFLWANLPVDRPENIVSNLLQLNNNDTAPDLKWTHLDTPAHICQHVCCVAAGLAPRPSRPDRPVVFRPFSSRDAHILLQIKRTLATFDNHTDRLGKLLRSALAAGKAARNVDRVPALHELRAYGTGDSSAYSSQPPAAVMERVKEAAMRDAIEPTVQKYLESLQAEAAAWQIATLRQDALALCHNASEESFVRQQLHAPTVALRRGEWVEKSAFLQGLQLELGQQRSD